MTKTLTFWKNCWKKRWRKAPSLPLKVISTPENREGSKVMTTRNSTKASRSSAVSKEASSPAVKSRELLLHVPWSVRPKCSSWMRPRPHLMRLPKPRFNKPSSPRWRIERPLSLRIEWRPSKSATRSSSWRRAESASQVTSTIFWTPVVPSPSLLRPRRSDDTKWWRVNRYLDEYTQW